MKQILKFSIIGSTGYCSIFIRKKDKKKITIIDVMSAYLKTVTKQIRKNEEEYFMYKMIMQNKFILALFIFFIFTSNSYSDGIPKIINYQGKLTDTSGNLVPDGQYGIVFSIYDVSTGGTALWSETWNSSTTPITIINGEFSVLLGTHNPIPASFFNDHPNTYLGIKVGSDSEMTPRQKIASVGYAFKAEYGVPKGAIIMWSGAIDQIPEGWALCDGNNGTPDLRNRFIVGAGSGYAVGATGGEASHVLTISEMPSHTHIQNSHFHYQIVANKNGYGGADGATAGSGYDGSYHSTNSTSGTTATNQNTGAGQAHENRPPYYALAFIMKL